MIKQKQETLVPLNWGSPHCSWFSDTGKPTTMGRRKRRICNANGAPTNIFFTLSYAKLYCLQLWIYHSRSCYYWSWSLPPPSKLVDHNFSGNPVPTMANIQTGFYTLGGRSGGAGIVAKRVWWTVNCAKHGFLREDAMSFGTKSTKMCLNIWGSKLQMIYASTFSYGPLRFLGFPENSHTWFTCYSLLLFGNSKKWRERAFVKL